MKEINRIRAVYEQIDFSERRVALATVVYVEGSAHRRPGDRILVRATMAAGKGPSVLDLGAEIPDEIAPSILSEINAFFSQRTSGFLTDRPVPIHERASVEEAQAVD